MDMKTPGMQYFVTLDAARVAPWLAALRARSPEGGVIALLAEADKDQLPALQALCKEARVPLAGAIFPALVQDEGFASRGVWLLGIPRMPAVRLLADLEPGATEAASRMAAAVSAQLATARTQTGSTLFMIFDGMVPNIASILDALYLTLADRVRYMGVNAGSETFQPMPCLFDADRIAGNGVLCLLFEDHPGAVLEHSYTAPEDARTATATVGNRIISIDWRPAFEVYQELISTHYGVSLTRENFYEYATHFPFGILLANGDVLVRIPVMLQDDGSLFCVGEIPANALLTLLQAPAPGTTGSVEQLAQGLAGTFLKDDDALLTFYCAGRRMHLGPAAQAEIAALHGLTGRRTLAGALSLGEIGSIGKRGYPQFHNATLVCSPWPHA